MANMTLLYARWASVALLGLLTFSPIGASAGMTPAEVEVFEGFKVKAEQGDAQSQYSMGDCYYYGIGVSKDQSRAVTWWRKAAEQGNDMALYNLALSYYAGEGVAKDLEQAVLWFRKAAEMGHDGARLQLGLRFANGGGLARDDIEAYAYLNLAGVSLDEARTNLAILEKKMTTDQIASGQRRTVELRNELDAAFKLAAKPLASSGTVEAVPSKVFAVADSNPNGAPAREQAQGGKLVWVIFFLLLLLIVIIGLLVAVWVFKKAASVARAKASSDSPYDAKPKHGFLYYWALSSLAILAFLSALGYLNGGASGFAFQFGRGLIIAPLGGLVVGVIWKVLFR